MMFLFLWLPNYDLTNLKINLFRLMAALAEAMHVFILAGVRPS